MYAVTQVTQGRMKGATGCSLYSATKFVYGCHGTWVLRSYIHRVTENCELFGDLRIVFSRSRHRILLFRYLPSDILGTELSSI
jgi:hypothetical protein